MRISRWWAVLAVTACGTGGALALDPNLSPSEALRDGYEAYKAGDAATALEALNFAGDRGVAGALWKLGRMYGTGDLVTEDDRKAMEIYTRIARDYGDGNPRGPDAPYVADALVTLGRYYRTGVPGSVNPDPVYARGLFKHAAAIFGSPDAQFLLASMLLQGEGGEQDPRAAAGWLGLAANKGHIAAQLQLGDMLYEGLGVMRQPVEGLMWLTIARRSSPGDPVIQAHHEQAFSTAEEDTRRRALAEADRWIKNSTGGAQAQIDARQ